MGPQSPEAKTFCLICIGWSRTTDQLGIQRINAASDLDRVFSLTSSNYYLLK